MRCTKSASRRPCTLPGLLLTAIVVAGSAAADSLRAEVRSRVVQFTRGDANLDRSLDVADPVAILVHLFLGDPGELACGDAGDVDDNGRLEVADVLALLEYLFLDGPPPSFPSFICFGICRSVFGFDPTTDDPFLCGDPADVGGDRPFRVFVPSTYDGTPLPLVLSLHGLDSSGAVVESRFPLRPWAEESCFLHAAPDGAPGFAFSRFWNATNACCRDVAGGDNVDDVGFLVAAIEEIEATLNVDPRRIYILGYSNGGFMGYRLACDRPDKISGVISIAGATWLDPEMCQPRSPVHILQIQGIDDEIVFFDGGNVFNDLSPGARETISRWGDLNDCATEMSTETKSDLLPAIPGEETTRTVLSGCRPGGSVELWASDNAGHFSFYENELLMEKIVQWIVTRQAR